MMTNRTLSVADRLRIILADMTGKRAEDIKDEHRLGADVGLDSLDSAELLYQIDDELGVFIDDDEYHAKIETVAQLRERIERGRAGE